jgi:hypothetical protein
MSSVTPEQKISLSNYNILNTIVPKYYMKKFPYNIISRGSESGLELTHKNVDLIYIKDKNYFVETKHLKKYKRGGVYGGSSEKIKVYFM